ncbi:MAG: transposase [Elusimicrobiota bacterium]|jgi:transposase|nr:transposase [Elusimicrobiota bacterium]
MAPKRYTEDFKKMVSELYNNGASVKQLSSEYGIIDKTIYTWIKFYSPNKET